MVPVSLPDSALGHIPGSRSPLTGAFGALVTLLAEGAPRGGLCRDVRSEQHFPVCPRGAAGATCRWLPGVPHPARRALTGPTEQTRQVCVPLALDPAPNEGCDGADRETEAGRSQERRVRLGGKWPRRRPPRSPQREQDRVGAGSRRPRRVLGAKPPSRKLLPTGSPALRQGLLSRVQVTEAATATSRVTLCQGLSPDVHPALTQLTIVTGATSLPVTPAWSGRHCHPIHAAHTARPPRPRGLPRALRARGGLGQELCP